MPAQSATFAAFDGTRMIAAGDIRGVVGAVKAAAGSAAGPLLVFHDATGRVVDLDLRGSVEETVERLPDTFRPAEPAADEPKPSGRGRPKLGVVAREVTLLPRHWDWLSAQRGGASATLRRLVEEASRASVEKDRRRNAQEAAYRFMSAMAGDLADFEEASRALFAGDGARFEALLAAWPPDIASYTLKLAAGAFTPAPSG